MVAAVIGEFGELSGDYRIQFDQRPPYDFLPVQVELAKGQGRAPGLASRVERAIKSKLGATARVTVLPAASFPVTEGKTKRVLRTHK
jgi:phenylacetate-CoA ligase